MTWPAFSAMPMNPVEAMLKGRNFVRISAPRVKPGQAPS